MLRHGLRNGAIPVITYLGNVLGGLLEGVVITEFIFSWPGLGRLTFEAISRRDYPMIQGDGGACRVRAPPDQPPVDLAYGLLTPGSDSEGHLELS